VSKPKITGAENWSALCIFPSSFEIKLGFLLNMTGAVSASGKTAAIPHKNMFKAKDASPAIQSAYKVKNVPVAIPKPKSAITAIGLHPVCLCSIVVSV